MKPHPHYKALYYAFVYHLSKYIEDVLDIYYLHQNTMFRLGLAQHSQDL